MSTSNWLLYGAYGYTGQLILDAALRVGLRPTLAGRDADKLKTLSEVKKLPWLAFNLDDVQTLTKTLEPFQAVLHCAGPFIHTYRQMAEACLTGRTHYLDITGEIEVFEGLAAWDKPARRAGVSLLPGVGFDVVPTDCLAAHLHRRLPDATHLKLAFAGGGGISRGTRLTMLEGLGRPGAVRLKGCIAAVPAAWKTLSVDFGKGPRTVTTIPWGDVSTAWYSTGIPNVEVYTELPPASRRMLIASRYTGLLLRLPMVRARFAKRIRHANPGPSEQARKTSSAYVWGEVFNEKGQRACSLIDCPNGYSLTANAAVAALQHVLAGKSPAGFQTPSRAFGTDFVVNLPGVTRKDME